MNILKDAPPPFPDQPAAPPLKKSVGKIFVRDMVLIGIAGPAIEFVLGFLYQTFLGAQFATYHVLPVYGHTSLLSPLLWAVPGALALHFYRRFLV